MSIETNTLTAAQLYDLISSHEQVTFIATNGLGGLSCRFFSCQLTLSSRRSDGTHIIKSIQPQYDVASASIFLVGNHYTCNWAARTATGCELDLQNECMTKPIHLVLRK